METQEKITAYTASEAARELGVSPTQVYRWLKDGTLDGLTTLKGRIKLVDAGSVLDLKRERELAEAK